MTLQTNRPVRFRFSVLALIAAATIAPNPAFAAPTSATPSQTEYRAALTAMDQKDWGKAQRILLGLWNQAHTYDVAASLGQLEYYRKNYAASARYISYALANVPPKEDPALVQRLNAALEELKPRVGTAHILVNETSAEVRVNGEVVGVSPLASDVFFDPGAYDVEARLGSERVVTQRLVVSAGETYNVSLDVPPAPPSANGGAPVVPVQEPAPAPADPVPDPASKSMIPVYVGVGVATVGLGMAIGFGIGAKSAKDEANGFRSELGPDGCTRGSASSSACSVASDAYDRQRRDATLTKVGIGITAVGVVATLAYVLWPTKSGKDSTARTVPQPAVALDRNSGTLLFTGQF